MYYELIVVGVMCLAAPCLAKMSGFEAGRMPLDLVGVGGIFFLLSASFGVGMNLIAALTEIGTVFMVLSMLLGWIALGAGALWGMIEVIHEVHDGLLQHKP
jgi:hypothetical protein